MNLCGDAHYLYMYSYDPNKIDNLKANIKGIELNDFGFMYVLVKDRLIYDPESNVEYRYSAGNFANIQNPSIDAPRSIAYIIRDNNPDTLYLIHNNVIKKDYELTDNPCNVQDSVLLSKGISWFPQKMHRVNKIDYKRFDNEYLEKINLKEPWKDTWLTHPKKLFHHL